MEFYQAIALLYPKHLEAEGIFFKTEIVLSFEQPMFCYAINGQSVTNMTKKDFTIVCKATQKSTTFRVKKDLKPNFGPYISKEEIDAYHYENIFQQNESLVDNEKTLNFSSLSFEPIISVKQDSFEEVIPDIDRYYFKLQITAHKWQTQKKYPCVKEERIHSPSIILV